MQWNRKLVSKKVFPWIYFWKLEPSYSVINYSQYFKNDTFQGFQNHSLLGTIVSNLQNISIKISLSYEMWK